MVLGSSPVAVTSHNKSFGKLHNLFLATSATTLVNNPHRISDDFKLTQTLKNYFESAIGKLAIKECEASSGVNANSGSKDSVDVAIKKYKDHPRIKMINVR